MLTGNFGVGKSALFNCLMGLSFETSYTSSIGVRTGEKAFTVAGKTQALEIWDIAGEVLQHKVPLTYFEDKQVILYVVDLTRMSGSKNYQQDLKFLEGIKPKACKLLVIGNKKDMLNMDQINEMTYGSAGKKFDCLVSAKTGDEIHRLLEQIWE